MMPPMAMLTSIFDDVLAAIPEAFDEDFVGHPLADVLTRDAPAAVAETVDAATYKIQGSRGQGNWAGTVWLQSPRSGATTSSTCSAAMEPGSTCRSTKAQPSCIKKSAGGTTCKS